MTPWRIIQGDVRKVAGKLEPNSFDALFCDPPYGLSFMGKRWDYFVPSPILWSEVLRALKPGARGIVFGGSRTYHRLVTALEDGGFVPTDQVHWLYSQGYPKSVKVSVLYERAKEKIENDVLAKMRADVLVVTRWVASVLKEEGLTRPDLDLHFGTVGMAGHWATQASQPTLMDRKEWAEFQSWTGRKPPHDVHANYERVRAAIKEVERGKGEREWRMFDSLRNDPGGGLVEPDNVWKGHGTALKPAFEPAALVMKNPDGGFGENAYKWGCGSIDIDAGRVPAKSRPALGSVGSSVSSVGAVGLKDKRTTMGTTDLGRWPANVILDDEAGAMLDAQSGERKSTLTGRADPTKQHEHTANKSKKRGSMFGNTHADGPLYADSGGASRFFYCAKASREEKELGLGGDENIHPTVKPLELTRYFARMLLPPKQPGRTRRILVPFSGVASEMIGCLQAGWDEVVGIELEPKYIAIAERRIKSGGVFSKLDRAFLKKLRRAS